jgi:hypothetical protein
METNPTKKSGYCVAFPESIEAESRNDATSPFPVPHFDRSAFHNLRSQSREFDKLWELSGYDYVGREKHDRKWACLTGCFPRQFWKLLSSPSYNKFSCTKVCTAMPTEWSPTLGSEKPRACFLWKRITCTAVTASQCKKQAGCGMGPKGCHSVAEENALGEGVGRGGGAFLSGTLLPSSTRSGKKAVDKCPKWTCQQAKASEPHPDPTKKAAPSKACEQLLAVM